MTDREALLQELRHGQAAVIQTAVPDLAQRGAVATPRDGDLLEGRVVSQRIQAELPEGAFEEERVFDAAVAVWRPEGEAALTGLRKQDGGRRLDLVGADGAYHSITFLLRGRVLQITSFSPLSADVAVPEGEEDPRRLALDAEELAFGPDYSYRAQA